MRFLPGIRAGALTTLVLLTPAWAAAQAIGGTVTDQTGAVLPGVTVEVRSPVLIEQVRTAVTDGAGEYLITGLLSGVYTVTCTLDGFRVVDRDGIRLSAGFTAPVDVELAVGALTETVTVTTASPVVDVRGVTQQRSMNHEVIDTIPSGKSYQALAELIPGMVVSLGAQTVDVGGLEIGSFDQLSIHGGVPSDHQLEVDGLPTGAQVRNVAGVLVAAQSSYGEYAFSYAANAAEVQTGGVRVNLIPQGGGNTFSGRVFANGSHSDLQANNIDDDLIARGLPADSQNRLSELWSIEASVGGPIVRDRLWFHLGHVRSVADAFVAGLFADSDANDLNYTPLTNDPSRQTIFESLGVSSSLRLTWQATTRNKFTAYWDHNGGPQTRNLFAESSAIVDESAFEQNNPAETVQVTWTNPVTTRLLLEAGFSHHALSVREESDPRVDRRLPGAFLIDQGVAVRGIGYIALVTPAAFLDGVHGQARDGFTNGYRASLSYITGSHAFKAGVTAEQIHETRRPIDDPSQFLFTWQDQLRPFRLGFAGFTANGTAIASQIDPNLGLYVQDQWTRDRMTVNAGLRFDYQRAHYPDQIVGVSRYRAEPFPIEGDTPIRWSDLQPRLGVAYDLFGNGRTALKASANRYSLRFGIESLDGINPADPLPMFRGWLDANGDGVVQGDPLILAANGELIFSDGNPGFGQPVQTTFVDPDWAVGWGKRSANWEYSASVQHELRPNVSLDVGFFYRTFVNFSVAADRNLGPEDFTTYTLFVPEGPEFPNGGGTRSPGSSTETWTHGGAPRTSSRQARTTSAARAGLGRGSMSPWTRAWPT